MARVKFGSIVTEGHGSLGGHTFQNSHGGAQMRSKPINKKKPSLAQSLIRSFNSQLQAGWQSLTDVQRKIWNEYAISHDQFNKNGDKHHLSGHSLWMKFNFNYLSDDLPLITSPFSYLSERFGVELINQSLWNATGLSYWPVKIGNFIGDGACILLDPSCSTIAKGGIFPVTTSYRVNISVTILSGDIFLPYDGSHVSVRAFSSGAYSFDYNFIAFSTLNIFSNLCTGSLDSLSIKRIL